MQTKSVYINHKDLYRRTNGLMYKKYAKGPFTGTAVSLYNNGQVKTKESYKYGRLFGVYEEFFKNGRLKQHAVYWGVYYWDGVRPSYTIYVSVIEILERSGYLVYQSMYGDGDHLQFDVFKDGKPLDSFAVERQNSEYAVGRYKGHWDDAPVPEFIRERKKDALPNESSNIREGVWEWFSALESSFDSNQHGSEIWHELSCTAWLFRKVHIKNEIRNEESTYNVGSRMFFKGDQVYRDEYFKVSGGGRTVTHYNKDGSSLIDEFDADNRFIKRTWVHTDSISDIDDDIPF